MKLIGILIILFFPFTLQASCACTCNLMDQRLCEPDYDLDNPCPSICPSHAPTMPPPRTACPTQKVYIPEKGAYVWITLCND
ncbi:MULTISPECIES: hypothetical protein [Legionella]|uniref:Uncharacterized protein n=1 Tax=Legionella drozanskii LLAP-1 TaxID=1212489 RepID=A0A0W0SMJ3_9GAMM|nr:MULTISPECIES: hypothetical protein [Legionella]KTC84591.1 hypothetical protein Ldro_2755 [Legionella drozanskii LLAP-1]PJE18332.1 MAG: hypothetical protein CK430_00280 [Legionella sp.]